ncbi:sulfite exporter TauE/SafE family protein 5-like isoform X2 [Musa acuminata AAA Group]|uniref:sulfite exporter TauE/SafE family protein 5-like isoform X2 n=1 Tax=Musa acuminata AAA Group TaxID=214697 RepID=UPI0031DAE2EB
MKTWCSMFLLRSVLPLPMAIILVTFAGGTNSTSQHHGVELLLKQLTSWRQHQKESMQGEATTPGYRTLVSCLLCFIAASVSSAGGVGGGSLFLPILNLVAGLDLKAATTYSAFMVTGGSIANVLCNLFFTSVGTEATNPPINYEIALLSQPSMLLGVSLGVICNIMFPEWLITVLFAVFLACSTFRTCKAGVRCWHAETEETETTDGHGRERSVNGAEEALLGGAQSGRIRFPWKDVVVLVMIWVCFFLLHVLAGDKHGKGAINLKPCGVAYWFITLSQIPLAIAFTAYVLYEKKDSHHRQVDTQQTHAGQSANKDPGVAGVCISTGGTLDRGFEWPIWDWWRTPPKPCASADRDTSPDCSGNKQFHGDVLSFHDHGQVHNPGNDTSRSSFGLCSAVLCSLGYWIDGHERNRTEVGQSFSYCVHSHRRDGRKHDHHNLLWCD